MRPLFLRLGYTLCTRFATGLCQKLWDRCQRFFSRPAVLGKKLRNLCRAGRGGRTGRQGIVQPLRSGGCLAQNTRL